MRVALAWGGGIGSLLALDALRGHDVTLVNVPVREDDPRHVPAFVVEEQAAALGLPLVLAKPDGPQTGALGDALRAVRPERVAFGYLRGEEYEQYHLAKALQGTGIEAMLPVRHLPAGEAARQTVEQGHRAFVRAVAPLEGAPLLGPDLLGRFLDAALVDDVDGAAGRRGWANVRALAVGGPLFRRRAGVLALEPRRVADAWRLDLGARGC